MPSNKPNQELPSFSPQAPSADIIANFKLLSEIFQKIEEETAEIAELIFEYLINVPDENIMMGTIPPHKNPRINAYLKILNRLFSFSRKHHNQGGFRVINRKTIEDLDKKTFTICMCFDGGGSLDILCDVVNTENQVRTPTRSPVKITIKKAFGNVNDVGLVR
jgi:hypothetical protein